MNLVIVILIIVIIFIFIMNSQEKFMDYCPSGGMCPSTCPISGICGDTGNDNHPYNPSEQGPSPDSPSPSPSSDSPSPGPEGNFP
jgi:hypothetical protein